MFSKRYSAADRVLAGVLIGAGLAALYSVLIAVVHFVVHWRWDNAHLLAIGFVLAGSALGVVVGSTYSGPERRRRRAPRVTINVFRPNRMTLALAAA
jgi:hypothetical protein